MPIYRKSIVVFLLLALVMVGGGMYGYTKQEESIPLSKGDLSETQKKEQIAVYVCGGVVRSGVVSLDGGARVIDAVNACGGALPNADVTKINMAKLLKDGEQIQVPIQEEALSEQNLTAEHTKKVNNKSSQTNNYGLVNINTADQAELDSLPGVGPSTAAAILEYRKQIGYIPETPSLYEELTLREHIEVTAMAYDIPMDTAMKRAEKLLETFRLSNRLDWFPANFSKGMKQKVMILCAFLIEPSLYIIDEPFLGLDPLAINALLELMVEMKKEGAGILMSTHILATAEKYCDRFVVLHNGEIRADGSLEMLRKEFQLPDSSLDEIYIALTKEQAHE